MINDTEIAAIIAEMENENEEKINIHVEENPETEERYFEDDILIENNPAVEVKTYNIGDPVVLSENAVNITGAEIPAKFKQVKVYIRTIKNGCYGFSLNKTGKTSGFLVKPEYINSYIKNQKPEKEFKSYLILVKTDELNIKSQPNETSKTLKTIHKDGLYTIVDEYNNWGHLKIGGWIPLDYVKKLSI